MKSVCVFCGSSPGARAEYGITAKRLGTLLAEQGLDLVFGGGNVGMMGTLANAALAAGGRVLGVIPRALVTRELAHTGLTEQHIVASMHERKQRMADLADAFIALPGGWGTLDELSEMMTWAQLAIHVKPVGLLNVAGFFDGLLLHLAHAEREGLLKPTHRRLLLVDTEPVPLLERMRAYRSPHVERAAERPNP